MGCRQLLWGNYWNDDFFALGLFIFLHGGEVASLPREYISDEEILRQTMGYIALFSFTTFCSTLPYGLFQWLILKNEFRVSFLWTSTYSLGAILFIPILFASVELVSNGEFSTLTWLFIVFGWLGSNVLTGGLQAILVRRKIFKAYLMIPINLLATIALGVSLGVGFALDEIVHYAGAIFGGALACLTHSGIIGLCIMKLRDQAIE